MDELPFLPKDVVVHILQFLPMRNRISMRLINSDWRQAADDSITKLTSLTVDDEESDIGQHWFRFIIEGSPNLITVVWNPPSRSSIPSRFFSWPPIACASLRHLQIGFEGLVNDASLESMTGRLPNLQQLVVADLRNVSHLQFDLFIDSCPNLSSIKIKRRSNVQFGMETSAALFRRTAIQSIVIDYSTNWVESFVADGRFFFKPDAFVINAVTSFPNLVDLKLMHVDLSDDSVGAIGRLKKLENLELRAPAVSTSSVDRGLLVLAAGATSLENITLTWSINPSTLAMFLRTCPNLYYMGICGVRGIDTTDEAVAIIGALRFDGNQRRETIISMGDRIELWTSDEVKAALKVIRNRLRHDIQFS